MACLIILVLFLTVVEGVPISKEGSGWPEQPKQEDDLVTVELIKNPFEEEEEKSSFYGNFSFFESSIEEKSISEYGEGFANDRNYEVPVAVNDVTTPATLLTSKEHGGEKDREKEKQPTADADDKEPKTVTDRRKPNNKTNFGDLYLNKVGLSLMICGLVTVVLLVGVLSASVIKLIRKLRA